ncbi:MAG: helix-turn-helix domain-containing protein [Rhodospirillales bacterium]
MYAQQKRNTEEARKLRKEGGKWLKGLRKAAGLTQRELANKVGLDYYTFISQVENGTGRVPPDMLEKYAEAVGMSSFDFTKRLISYYDPFTFKALWGKGDYPHKIHHIA